MLDFAKSIMVGNATDRNGKELKVGDMVAVKTSDPSLNHGRIVRISGDQISVDVTGDDDIWTTPARQAVKMGNSKPRNIGNAKVINSDREFFKELADDAKEREDKDKQEVEKLVENSIEWEVRESDVIDYIHGNPTATALQRVCQKELGTYDTSGVQAVLVDEKTNKWAVVKRGTAAKKKTGNTTVSEYNAEIQRLTRKAEQLRRMGQGKSAMEVEKQIEKLGKELAEVGNSASDDKFAYVMREFDEGKLKTPDGKVVTDPAQAKAIAYSESKKTENGLARARNAMVKNIATYKDFIKDLKNAIMLDVAGINYDSVDEQTLKTWVEQAKKDGYASAIKGLQGKKVILDVY